MFNALLLALTTSVQHLPTTVVRAPDATLTLQVARTEEQREFGLMNVSYLLPHTGMVFVFDRDQPVEFWMKDTIVPLDMVFVAPSGVVRTVFEDVPSTQPDTPDDKIPRRDGEAKFVLELPAFEAKKDGIETGVRLSGLAGLKTQ